VVPGRNPGAVSGDPLAVAEARPGLWLELGGEAMNSRNFVNSADLSS